MKATTTTNQIYRPMRLPVATQSLKIVKFIYSGKATKFCEISTVYLTVTTEDKFKVEILQNFVAFSEYMNFISEAGPFEFLPTALCLQQ